jgi:hypothetical protein
VRRTGSSSAMIARGPQVGPSMVAMTPCGALAVSARWAAVP